MNNNSLSSNTSSVNNVPKWRWSNILVDALFFINTVSYFLTVFIGGNFKYIAIVSTLIFLCYFYYKSRKKELNYSRFIETMPVLVHLFGLYILLSAGWSINRQSTLHMFVAYELCAVLFSCFYVHYRGTKDGIKHIQIVLVCAGLCITAIITAYLGLDQLRQLVETGQRMGIRGEYDKKLVNVNIFAFVMLTTSLILFTSFVNNGAKLWHLCIIPLVLLICITGCRKAFGGLLLASFVVIAVSLWKQRNARRLFWIFLTVILISFLFVQLFSSQFAVLTLERTQTSLHGNSSSDDLRLEMAKLGWEIFLKYPLLGCGIDCPRFINAKVLNFSAYLHNDVAELLAGGGLAGFMLFYTRYFLIMKMCWKQLARKRVGNDVLQAQCLCLGLLVVLAIYQFAGVIYYNFGVLCFTFPLYVCYGNYSHRLTLDARKVHVHHTHRHVYHNHTK